MLDRHKLCILYRILSNRSLVKCIDILLFALVTFTSGAKVLQTLHPPNKNHRERKNRFIINEDFLEGF